MITLIAFLMGVGGPILLIVFLLEALAGSSAPSHSCSGTPSPAVPRSPVAPVVESPMQASRSIDEYVQLSLEDGR